MKRLKTSLISAIVLLLLLAQPWRMQAVLASTIKEYSFRLSENLISCSSADDQPAGVISLAPAPDLEPEPQRLFWHLTYRIGEILLLPAALPLLVVIDELNSASFVLTAAEADGVRRQLCGELVAGWSLPQLRVQPLFAALPVEWSVIVNVDPCPMGVAAAGMSELLAVREADGSLTVLFRQSDQYVLPKRYLLSCLASQEQHSLWQRHFLWPSLQLAAGRPSMEELIFQVADFACQQQLRVTDLLTGQQLETVPISVEDLYATD